jgi:hypothetical protein
MLSRLADADQSEVGRRSGWGDGRARDVRHPLEPGHLTANRVSAFALVEQVVTVPLLDSALIRPTAVWLHDAIDALIPRGDDDVEDRAHIAKPERALRTKPQQILNSLRRLPRGGRRCNERVVLPSLAMRSRYSDTPGRRQRAAVLASPHRRCDPFTRAGRRERRGQPNPVGRPVPPPGPTRSDRNHTVVLEQNVTPFRPARRRAPVLLQLGMNQRLPDPAARSIAVVTFNCREAA